MPGPEWVWLPDLQRYRNLSTGRFLASETVRQWARQAIEASGSVISTASEGLSSGVLSVGDWQALVREELKATYIQEYVLGRGGLEQMTQQDWGSIGGMLAEQYRYLDDFAAEIASGNLTQAQVEARLAMYFDSSSEAFERANARAHGVPELPQYPGDGSTRCLTNCRCHWEIEETDGGWEARWILDPAAENCDDCIENAQKWNPLVIER